MDMIPAVIHVGRGRHGDYTSFANRASVSSNRLEYLAAFGVSQLAWACFS